MGGGGAEKGRSFVLGICFWGVCFASFASSFSSPFVGFLWLAFFWSLWSFYTCSSSVISPPAPHQRSSTAWSSSPFFATLLLSLCGLLYCLLVWPSSGLSARPSSLSRTAPHTRAFASVASCPNSSVPPTVHRPLICCVAALNIIFPFSAKRFFLHSKCFL